MPVTVMKITITVKLVISVHYVKPVTIMVKCGVYPLGNLAYSLQQHAYPVITLLPNKCIKSSF